MSLKPTHPLRVYHLQFGLAMGLGKHPPCPVDEVVGNGEQRGATPGTACPRPLTRPPSRLLAGSAPADRRRRHRDLARLSAGWEAFNLNKTQHAASLNLLAKLDPQVVGVGHGEPITKGGGDRIHELVQRSV